MPYNMAIVSPNEKKKKKKKEKEKRSSDRSQIGGIKQQQKQTASQ